jgi:hypothetical protein
VVRAFWYHYSNQSVRNVPENTTAMPAKEKSIME